MSYYSVDLYEYERGWGSKLDETYYFRSKILADNYARDFNSKNTEKSVPDWYMIAYEPTEESDGIRTIELDVYFSNNKGSNRVSYKELQNFLIKAYHEK